MRCVGYCSAGGYKLAAVAEYFKTQRFSTTFYRSVLHVSKPNKKFDIFFFPIGCLVIWNSNKQQEEKLLEQIKPFATDIFEKPETSRFIYQLGDVTNISSHKRFSADIITIDRNEIDNVQLKLAISYGLVQSVKLQVFEESIQKTINNNNPIPKELARKGYISLSRRLISKRIGEIFLERSSVNLTSEYFDVPEYFWDYPALERYYVMTEQFLDIPKRAAALNQKLDVLHEMFEMLNNQLEHRYSSMLETIIILLIAIEIIINLVRWH